MPGDFIPAKDADLLAWSGNFNTQLTAAPTSVGLVVGDATAYDTLHDDFALKLTAATDPGTRTEATVAAKNTSRAALTFKARALSRIIQAFSGTTDAERATFGLTIPDATGTPIAAPVTKPVATVSQITSGQHTIRLQDELTPLSRAKPFGAIGAEVYVKRGTTPPVTTADCVFVGVASRDRMVIDHSGATPGQTAYYLCRWINGRGQRGPVSSVVSGTIAA